MRIFGLSIIVFVICLSLLYLYPGSADNLPEKTSFEIIAQRGVHQDYPREIRDPSVCTAALILEPTHDYIDNTMASIQAAFDYGATVVEVDVRPTKDHQLVVFHDDKLNCQTDGEGYVWDSTLADLRLLDLGYGFTFDDGKTYPFRGKGVGKMVTLKEVIQAFPDKRFLVDHKNRNDKSAAELMTDFLLSLSTEDRERIYLRMTRKGFDYVREEIPDVKRLLESRRNQGRFFKEYKYSLGLFDLKGNYAGKGYAVPVFMKKYLFGWPYRFLNKAYAAGARIYVFINSREELDEISGIPFDGIVTYKIESLGLSTD